MRVRVEEWVCGHLEVREIRMMVRVEEWYMNIRMVCVNYITIHNYIPLLARCALITVSNYVI